MVTKLFVVAAWIGSAWLVAIGAGPLALLVPVGLYVGHLRIYPDRRCPAGCSGGHVYSGGMFRNASHPCGRCGGRGRIPRIGSALVARRERS